MAEQTLVPEDVLFDVAEDVDDATAPSSPSTRTTTSRQRCGTLPAARCT